jgi:hypothetical protein
LTELANQQQNLNKTLSEQTSNIDKIFADALIINEKECRSKAKSSIDALNKEFPGKKIKFTIETDELFAEEINLGKVIDEKLSIILSESPFTANSKTLTQDETKNMITISEKINKNLQKLSSMVENIYKEFEKIKKSETTTLAKNI